MTKAEAKNLLDTISFCPTAANKKFDTSKPSNDYAPVVAWCCQVCPLLFISISSALVFCIFILFTSALEVLRLLMSKVAHNGRAFYGRILASAAHC